MGVFYSPHLAGGHSDFNLDSISVLDAILMTDMLSLLSCSVWTSMKYPPFYRIYIANPVKQYILMEKINCLQFFDRNRREKLQVRLYLTGLQIRCIF